MCWDFCSDFPYELLKQFSYDKEQSDDRKGLSNVAFYVEQFNKVIELIFHI